jgi:beta-lactam-binding protein with PASTA domain
VQRRGLELGNVSAVSSPATTESQVLAQSPPPNTAASSPKVNLLVSSADASAYYLMPDFTGKQLSDVQKQIEGAGFELKVTTLNPAAPGSLSTILAKSPAAKKQVIVRQTPAAGHRIAAKSTITLEILVQ